MSESCTLDRPRSREIDRSELRVTEEFFDTVLTDIAVRLWPKPNTAAKIAAAVGCGTRNIELVLQGKQNWSGDAVAVIVGEICRRHHQRNVKIVARQ